LQNNFTEKKEERNSYVEQMGVSVKKEERAGLSLKEPYNFPLYLLFYEAFELIELCQAKLS
jgi:hypothetical protein